MKNTGQLAMELEKGEDYSNFEFPNLSGEKFVSLDTETTGLDVYGGDRVFAFCMGTKDKEWYIPIRQKGGMNVDEQNTLSFIRDICSDKSKKIIMANATFDLGMIRAENIEVEAQVLDVFAAANVFDNRLVKIGLKDLARKIGFTTEEETLKDKYIKENNIEDWSYIPNDIMAPYGLADARLTYDVFSHYMSTFTSQELKLLNLESRTTKVIFEMIWKGLRMDWDYVYQLGEELSTEMQLMQMKLMKHGVEPSRRETIIPFMKNEGLEIKARTPKGGISTDEDALAVYNHPVLNEVLAWRSVSKLYSTYVLNFISSSRNGIVHPKIWQNGTRTGRFSSNFQQLPKDDTRIKRSIIPRDGSLLWMCDLSQMEYRVFAALAEDETTISHYRENPTLDYHQMMADRLGITRQEGKTANFAILYGAGAKKLAVMLGCSVSAAYNILNKYKIEVPAIDKLRDKLERELRTSGYIRTPSGRKYYVEFDSSYKAVNYYVQGYCSDMIRYAMCQISDRFKEFGYSADITLQIHDELMGESDIRVFKDVIELVNNKMSSFGSLSVPILADPQYALNMGSPIEWNLEEFKKEYGR